MTQTAVAIIGSGNIGTDLLIKIQQRSQQLRVACLIGIDPDSEGLQRAKSLGIETCAGGLDGYLESDVFSETEIFFDATSAAAHQQHARQLEPFDRKLIDLTPAAIGPYIVPTVNLDQHLANRNVNLVTCGGQATIPIVAAISQVTFVAYAEIVASISSRSAGPGTRANIDEFTATTARGIEIVGGAQSGKAIIVLNPAEPPILMRNTVFCLVGPDADHELITNSVAAMVAKVQAYVPGYRLKQQVQIDRFGSSEQPLRIPGILERGDGWKVTVFLEVEGAGDFLPRYAGNLDVMTSAALATAECMVDHTRNTTTGGQTVNKN